MNKLIFRKFSLDILSFFLIASFSITFIVWIIQAVNFLDLVSDDGHSSKVYFYFVVLQTYWVLCGIYKPATAIGTMK